jgi:hypothetical protein
MITQAAVSEAHMRPVEPGTLLYSFKLTIGRMAIAGRRLFTNEAIAALVPRDDAVSARYLRFALSVADLPTSSRAVKGDTLNLSSLATIPVLMLPRQRERAFVERLEAELHATLPLWTAVEERRTSLKALERSLGRSTFS